MTLKLTKCSAAILPLMLSTASYAGESDPLYEHQWHLKNTGQSAFSQSGGKAGNDLNTKKAHKKGALGQGVQVSVVDTGLQIDHIDLADNVVPGSMDLITGGDYPEDTHGHGTAVGGIIAAVGFNSEGVRGIAPNAGINGFNFLSEQSMNSWLLSHGYGEGTEDTELFNQSYGSSALFVPKFELENDPELAIEMTVMEDVATNSNGGRGAAFVSSAGNSYNYYGFSGYYFLPGDYFDVEVSNHGLPMQNSNMTNSKATHWSTTVSAINANGERSSYSTVGANVFMTATGGEYGSDSPAMVTTDLMGCDSGFNDAEGLGDNGLHGGTVDDPDCNYTSVMNGTSSAAPSMVGAIAAVMSANPHLTTRDAKHVLALTAKKTDPSNKGVTLTFTDANGNLVEYPAIDGWKKNDAGFNYHLFYGLGRPNVSKAVSYVIDADEDDLEDIKLPPQLVSQWHDQSVNVAVPDVDPNGGMTSQEVDLDDFVIEGVEVILTIDHPRVTDLAIELISPEGTRSVLMTPRNGMYGQSFGGDGYVNKLLSSTHFYGEEAEGDWTLKVVDTGGEGDGDFVFYPVENVSPANNTSPGIINNWSLRFIGHEED
ncbi:S8 family peptidase [Shewanella sp. UCD-KL12]|uniref:S8 family peptidase n=1 Tax=Shewanella sp. UCD-KL12 TaxID=1917163 RepID=UPI000970B8C6|nr:S8 family peptidase [Shewanella sp. UCD-KL12]